MGSGSRVVRAHQLRQQRRHGDASRRRARSKGNRRPEDAVDASRARSVAAASARRGAVEADGESRRRNRGGSRHASWLELRCASGPGHVVHGRTGAAGGRDGTPVRVEHGVWPRRAEEAAAHPLRLLSSDIRAPTRCRCRLTVRAGARPWRQAKARACARPSRSRRRAPSSSGSLRRTPWPTRRRGRSGTCASTRHPHRRGEANERVLASRFRKACARFAAGRQPDRSDECRGRFSGEAELGLGRRAVRHLRAVSLWSGGVRSRGRPQGAGQLRGEPDRAEQRRGRTLSRRAATGGARRWRRRRTRHADAGAAGSSTSGGRAVDRVADVDCRSTSSRRCGRCSTPPASPSTPTG